MQLIFPDYIMIRALDIIMNIICVSTLGAWPTSESTYCSGLVKCLVLGCCIALEEVVWKTTLWCNVFFYETLMGRRPSWCVVIHLALYPTTGRPEVKAVGQWSCVSTVSEIIPSRGFQPLWGKGAYWFPTYGETCIAMNKGCPPKNLELTGPLQVFSSHSLRIFYYLFYRVSRMFC